MNIIITLPTMLADLIFEGKKTIEVRKRWPKHFDPKNDVVYICEKGTGLVTGLFTIEQRCLRRNPAKTWSEHKEQICIDEQWFFNYLKDSKFYFLAHIKQAERFPKPYSLVEVFGKKSAPQSYVYTDIYWYINDDFMIEVDRSGKKAVQ